MPFSAQNPPRSLPPVPDDDGVPFSAAVADMFEAVQDSMSIRLDLLQERVLDQTRNVAVQSLLWVGAIASLGAAWLATIVAFTIWVAAASGPVVAALWVAAIHLVAGVGFVIATRAHAVRDSDRAQAADLPGLG